MAVGTLVQRPPFPRRLLSSRPGQTFDTMGVVGLSRCIRLPMGCEGTGGDVFQAFTRPPQPRGRVPGLHQPCLKGPPVLRDPMTLPLLHMVPGGAALPVRMVDPVVDAPQPVQVGSDRPTAPPTPVHDGVGVAAVLASDKSTVGRIALLPSRLLTHDLPLGTQPHLRSNLLPHKAGRHTLPPSIPMNQIRTPLIDSPGTLGECLVGLRTSTQRPRIHAANPWTHGAPPCLGVETSSSQHTPNNQQ
ncbi:hypothetical protein U14_01275 [Candidatus Moduliflexus flocculans]|uniref:Uncharacterized protein n=1 Tax=Candidatus Moduliflexus flocculans TaxID=1499966 RepID=A0A0S6VS06_9BACT|nr:hypothetical protein U14_01275 [Candidatus Moduliflexus flocculans]